MLKQFIFILSAGFCFSSFSAGGVVEAVSTLAIQQELTEQSVQDGNTHLEHTQKKIKEYEELENKKKKLLEEALE